MLIWWRCREFSPNMLIFVHSSGNSIARLPRLFFFSNLVSNLNCQSNFVVGVQIGFLDGTLCLSSSILMVKF